nr:hypothetical protein [Elizabethkingia sp. ASV34]
MSRGLGDVYKRQAIYSMSIYYSNIVDIFLKLAIKNCINMLMQFFIW